MIAGVTEDCESPTRVWISFPLTFHGPEVPGFRLNAKFVHWNLDARHVQRFVSLVLMFATGAASAPSPPRKTLAEPEVAHRPSIDV